MPETPHLSVIIPARDAGATIGTQLEALAAQQWPGRWEVIVADNGSRDDTVARAEAWRDRLPGLRVIDASSVPGASHARNVAAELAAVVGHEIAHVIARHPAERMSREALVGTGAAVLGAATPELANMAAAAATLGLVLPFSREQEAEADAIGLQYMARAGYDPRAAVQVWRNFAALGDSGPSFLSTHPSPGDRIANLQSQMPAAMKIYEANRAN